MLTHSNNRTVETLLSCINCGKQFVKRGTRGPRKLRCADCAKSGMCTARRNKNGVHLATVCKGCQTKIDAKNGNKKFCADCVATRKRRCHRAIYYRKQGRIAPKQVGEKTECASCGTPITKSRADHIFCAACLRTRANAYNRKIREEQRRASGVQVRSGVPVKCARCSVEFLRSRVNQKFCAAHRHEPTVRYIKRRLKADKAFALNYWISAAIRKSLRGTKSKRRWQTLLGYTVEELKRHLERQFLRGMSWENRDEWHVDHIVPVSSFDFRTAEDEGFKRAWALTNLRPLWAHENLRKSDHRTHLI